MSNVNYITVKYKDFFRIFFKVDDSFQDDDGDVYPHLRFFLNDYFYRTLYNYKNYSSISLDPINSKESKIELIKPYDVPGSGFIINDIEFNKKETIVDNQKVFYISKSNSIRFALKNRNQKQNQEYQVKEYDLSFENKNRITKQLPVAYKLNDLIPNQIKSTKTPTIIAIDENTNRKSVVRIYQKTKKANDDFVFNNCSIIRDYQVGSAGPSGSSSYTKTVDFVISIPINSSFKNEVDFASLSYIIPSGATSNYDRVYIKDFWVDSNLENYIIEPWYDSVYDENSRESLEDQFLAGNNSITFRMDYASYTVYDFYVNPCALGFQEYDKFRLHVSDGEDVYVSEVIDIKSKTNFNDLLVQYYNNYNTDVYWASNIKMAKRFNIAYMKPVTNTEIESAKLETRSVITDVDNYELTEILFNPVNEEEARSLVELTTNDTIFISGTGYTIHSQAEIQEAIDANYFPVLATFKKTKNFLLEENLPVDLTLISNHNSYNLNQKRSYGVNFYDYVRDADGFSASSTFDSYAVFETENCALSVVRGDYLDDKVYHQKYFNLKRYFFYIYNQGNTIDSADSKISKIIDVHFSKENELYLIGEFTNVNTFTKHICFTRLDYEGTHRACYDLGDIGIDDLSDNITINVVFENFIGIMESGKNKLHIFDLSDYDNGGFNGIFHPERITLDIPINEERGPLKSFCIWPEDETIYFTYERDETKSNSRFRVLDKDYNHSILLSNIDEYKMQSLSYADMAAFDFSREPTTSGQGLVFNKLKTNIYGEFLSVNPNKRLTIEINMPFVYDARLTIDNDSFSIDDTTITADQTEISL